MQPDGLSERGLRLIRYERLVAPAEHLGVLVEPPAEALWAQVRAFAPRRFEAIPILDRSLGDWRASFRARLARRLDRSGPVIVTGHQPEFDHAGVFVKQMATRALAERHGRGLLPGGSDGGQAQALFLTVDSDVPKRTSVVLVQVNAGRARRVEVPIPGCHPHRTFEQQSPVARSTWLQFFASLTSLHPGGDASLLPAFARAWLTIDAAHPQYCDAWDRARVATERVLGLTPLPALRVSEMCCTPEFRAFAAHLLLHARDFAACYNDAQRAYREEHRVRARGRPVPPLATHASRMAPLAENEAVELPFWAFQRDEPRCRVFAVRSGERVMLLCQSGEASRTALQPIGAFTTDELRRIQTHAAPWPLERDGWFLRPRALALTAFARLFLADLFVHGIGGAKYDEMTERFVASFFHAELAPAVCVSATAYLPLPRSALCNEDLRRARRDSRDLRYNPQRHIAHAPPELLRERERLARQSDALRAERPKDHSARRLVFQSLRRVNERILQHDPWRAAHYDQRVATIQAQLEADRLVLDREYFYALHPPETLAQLARNVQAAIAP